jgi:hypothetical protein
MKAELIYERETGNVKPDPKHVTDEQWGDWWINYYEWLEHKVEKQYKEIIKLQRGY